MKYLSLLLISFSVYTEPVLYRNNLKNQFLTASTLFQSCDPHSPLAIRQYQNSGEPSFQIPECLTCFGINPAKRTDKPVNLIRQMLRDIPAINVERKELGLSPVINLSIGQPHLCMNIAALDPFIAYLENLKTLSPEELSTEMGYGNSAGLAETRLWISKSFTQDFPEIKEGFSLEEVMVANGAAGALTNALKVLVEKGDAVAVFAPYFAAYKNQVEGNEAKLIPIELDKNRSYGELLEKAVAAHSNIKVLIWNDPNNPLGTKATLSELHRLKEAIDKIPNLFIIHDEVYRDLLHFEESPLSLLNVAPELKNRSIVIRSLAKEILGAPGVRAGIVAAPTHLRRDDGGTSNLIDLMSNEQLIDVVSVSVLVQKLLVFSLQSKILGESKVWTEGLKSEYRKNVNFVARALKEMGLPAVFEPEGAFYILSDGSALLGKKIPNSVGKISGLNKKIGHQINNDRDIAAYFLYAGGVAVVPGSGFGTDRCSFRISCAQSEETLMEAMERLKEALSQLGPR